VAGNPASRRRLPTSPARSPICTSSSGLRNRDARAAAVLHACPTPNAGRDADKQAGAALTNRTQSAACAASRNKKPARRGLLITAARCAIVDYRDGGSAERTSPGGFVPCPRNVGRKR
jgi:hypothetical protein